MRHIWRAEGTGCLVSDLQQSMQTEQPMALTTLLTTLDRLFHKGILQRVKEGKAYRYVSAMTEEELEERIVSNVLGNLIERFPKTVATYFAEAGDCDRSRLSDLASRVQKMQNRKE